MWDSSLIGMQGNLLQLTLSAVESNVNIWDKLGQPTFRSTVLLTIEDTAVITGIVSGNLPAGTIIRLVSHGYFLGQGGNGGFGGKPAAGGDPAIPGGNGGVGSVAFSSTVEVHLDLSDGYIWGGGGGGGGGGVDNGGGGGGAVSGGSGGIVLGPGSPGADATTGIAATPGLGSDDGGDGGDWGQGGQAGSGSQAGAGGNGGLAIEMNGNNLVYLASSQAALIAAGRIRGAVG